MVGIAVKGYPTAGRRRAISVTPNKEAVCRRNELQLHTEISEEPKIQMGDIILVDPCQRDAIEIAPCLLFVIPLHLHLEHAEGATVEVLVVLIVLLTDALYSDALADVILQLKCDRSTWRTRRTRDVGGEDAAGKTDRRARRQPLESPPHR